MTERSARARSVQEVSKANPITVPELVKELGEKDWTYRRGGGGGFLLTRYDALGIDKIQIYIGKQSFFVRSGPPLFEYPTSESNYFMIRGLKSVKYYTRTKQMLAEGFSSSILLDLHKGAEGVHLFSKNHRASARMMTFALTNGTDVWP